MVPDSAALKVVARHVLGQWSNTKRHSRSATIDRDESVRRHGQFSKSKLCPQQVILARRGLTFRCDKPQQPRPRIGTEQHHLESLAERSDRVGKNREMARVKENVIVRGADRCGHYYPLYRLAEAIQRMLLERHPKCAQASSPLTLFCTRRDDDDESLLAMREQNLRGKPDEVHGGTGTHETKLIPVNKLEQCRICSGAWKCDIAGSGRENRSFAADVWSVYLDVLLNPEVPNRHLKPSVCSLETIVGDQRFYPRNHSLNARIENQPISH